jgi:hypothetical protein
VLDGAGAGGSRVEILEAKVEQLPSRASGEALRFFVRVETEAVRCVEEKGGERNLLKRGTVLPAGRFRPVAGERLEVGFATTRVPFFAADLGKSSINNRIANRITPVKGARAIQEV